MSGRVTEGVLESVQDLPAVIDREGFVGEGRAGDVAAKAFEGVALMESAPDAGPRLHHSGAGYGGRIPRAEGDAGVACRRVGRDRMQGQCLASGVRAGGDVVVDGGRRGDERQRGEHEQHGERPEHADQMTQAFLCGSFLRGGGERYLPAASADTVQNTPISRPAAIVAPRASQRESVSSSSGPLQTIGSCTSFIGNPRTMRRSAGAVVAAAATGIASRLPYDGVQSLLPIWLLVIGLISSFVPNLATANFQVNTDEIPEGRRLVCFGEQTAKNALARLVTLQTIDGLSVKEAHMQLGHEIFVEERKEFEGCMANRFIIRPYDDVVLDVEELGLGSWGDLKPYYFVQALVGYEGKWYAERRDNGAKAFALVDDRVVQRIDPPSK